MITSPHGSPAIKHDKMQVIPPGLSQFGGLLFGSSGGAHSGSVVGLVTAYTTSEGDLVGDVMRQHSWENLASGWYVIGSFTVLITCRHLISHFGCIDVMIQSIGLGLTVMFRGSETRRRRLHASPPSLFTSSFKFCLTGVFIRGPNCLLSNAYLLFEPRAILFPADMPLYEYCCVFAPLEPQPRSISMKEHHRVMKPKPSFTCRVRGPGTALFIPSEDGENFHEVSCSSSRINMPSSL